jgi:hypothetical protein
MSGQVKLSDEGFREIVRSGTDIADRLKREAMKGLVRARSLAPDRTGRLRAGVELREGEDDRRGVYYEIVTTVTSPSGYRYGSKQEYGDHPYLRKAFE